MEVPFPFRLIRIYRIIHFLVKKKLRMIRIKRICMAWNGNQYALKYACNLSLRTRSTTGARNSLTCLIVLRLHAALSKKDWRARRMSDLQKKGRGRPSTGGAYPLIGSRMPPELVRAIDEWAERHGFARAKAIRRLIQRGLEAKED